MDQPRIAEVVVDIPTKELQKVFDYIVPEALREQVELGSVVQVPFGRTVQAGYVVGFKSRSDLPGLVKITNMLEETILTDEQIQLARWMADYYVSSLSETLRLMLPPGRLRKANCIVNLIVPSDRALKETTRSPVQQEIVRSLVRSGGMLDLARLRSIEEKRDSISSALRVMERKGLIERDYKVGRPSVRKKQLKIACLRIKRDELEKLTAGLTSAPGQKEVMEVLGRHDRLALSELLKETRTSRSVVNALAKKGYIELVEVEVFREPGSFLLEEGKERFTLTAAQHEAVETISASLKQDRSDVFLLQGVTGSGKTEVYLRSISEVLEKEKKAIVLVPEISLTPQTVQRFKERFGDTAVAVLHSGLSVGERYDQWTRIARGDYHVVVGARSAVFAPLKKIGLIVVDEEHETTYKQNRNPRYNARDTAIKRAILNNASVILGSATPSLESRWLAEQGKYQQIILPERVQGKRLPQTEVIDMRIAFTDKSREYRSRLISPVLQERIKESSFQGGKTILFLNRRGYSGFIQCRDCGTVIKCRRCEVTMTYHLAGPKMMCHHCGSVCRPPQVCPECRSTGIGYFSAGTQRIEEEMNMLFPALPLIRMDTDSTRRKGGHGQKLADFTATDKAVLLGTQMIAKGLDFPAVTLVGIINADVALNLPDFRSGERTFQLLMQVSGRAGRGEKSGSVLIQSYQPENYAIKAVLGGSYDDFYSSEIEFRRDLGYPPFSKLINIIFSGKNEQTVEKVATDTGKSLKESNFYRDVEILGPISAPLSKIKDHYRWHLMIKHPSIEQIKDRLRQDLKVFNDQAVKEKVSLIIDVDPVTML